MRSTATVVAIALIGGCGDDLTKATWWHQSDRLVARAWATEPGYRYLFGWHDTLLDLDCAADAPACGPPVAIYFADASCHDVIASSPAELPPIAVYRDAHNGGHGIAIGRPFSGPLYIRRGGCVPAAATDPALFYAHATRFDDVLTSQIEERVGGVRTIFPKGAYVALADRASIDAAVATRQIRIEDGPDRLRTRYLLDGDVELAAGIEDAVLDTPCAPAPDPTGEVRCIPPLEVALYPAGTAFSDQACATPVDGALYATRGFARDGDGYLAIDTPVTASVFVRLDTTCAPAGLAQLWRSSAPAFAATELERMFVEQVAP